MNLLNLPIRTKRQDERMRFLRNEVLPHLKEMPTIDQYTTHVEVEDKDLWQDREFCGDNNLEIEYTVRASAKGDKAIFNLNTYINIARENENKISDKYNCGREGCFAGWYSLLGDNRAFLSLTEADEVSEYEIYKLARHFGITRDEANMLFSSLGKGIEGFPDDDFDQYGEMCTSHDLTKEALKARAEYLDELFEQYGISTDD